MSIKKTVAVNQPETIIKSTRIQSLMDAHLIYDGQVSGRHYEWTRAGAIVEVDILDVPELIAKRLGGKTCCGNEGGNSIFEIVGE